MHEQTFEHILMAAHVHAPESTGFIEVGARSLEQFTSLPKEAFAAFAADAPSIRIDRVAFGVLLDPRLRPAIRLADIGANRQRLQIVHRRSTVVALVGDDFLDHRDRVIGDGSGRFELLGGFGQRLLDRRRVTLVGALHGHDDNRTRLEIDGVLGFVRQMRPAIFHLRDLGIGIVRMGPVVIRPFFLRLRSMRAKSARVGVPIPDALASVVRNSS
jgi:hypothetical protein